MTKSELLRTVAATRPHSEGLGKKELKSVELPERLERNRLLDSAQSAMLLNYSLAHFRRLYQTGKVPAPVRINGRKMGWPAGVLIDFMAAQTGRPAA